MTIDLATVSQLRNPVNCSSNLRDVCHGVGAAHDGKVYAERHLLGRMPQPLADDIQRDPGGGQPVTGRTVPEAMGPSPLSPGTGRLLIQAGMLNASPQVPQGRLPSQPDNQVPRTVRCGPVGEQAGQVRVKRHGPAPLPPLPRRTSREPAVTSTSRHSKATVSPTRSPDRHIMSAATRARRSPRSSRESRSRSTCWGFQ